jgi:hypothetical protein
VFSDNPFMLQSSTISDYLDTLTRELSFDIPLARRVRREVEDHLWEAAAADPGDDPMEAQRLAVGRFGDPRAIASEYAALSLFRQNRRLGAIVILAAAGVLAAMMGRRFWYGLMHMPLSASLQGPARVAVQIDHYAFMLAFGIGILGWAYVSSRRSSALFSASCKAQLRRGLMLSAAATTPLLASVIADALVLGLRLSRAQVHLVDLIPMLSIAVEVGCAVLLVFLISKATRGAGVASSLFCG